MRKFILKKPECSTEPEPLDFKVINQPLEEVINQVIYLLKKENRKPECQGDGSTDNKKCKTKTEEEK